MISAIVAKVLGLLSGNVLDRVLGHLERSKASENERLKIEQVRQINSENLQAQVITTGMQFRVFWIAWSIAAIPTAAWYGWGMVDSMFNGSLPDVASLPPQLLRYADIVFGNIFYTGVAAFGFQAVSSAIKGR